jgi:hypothetical protein
LDALYENSHMIPENWKNGVGGNTLYIHFWGTTFGDISSGLRVFYLYFEDDKWHRYYNFVNSKFNFCHPAAVLE